MIDRTQRRYWPRLGSAALGLLLALTPTFMMSVEGIAAWNAVIGGLAITAVALAGLVLPHIRWANTAIGLYLAVAPFVYDYRYVNPFLSQLVIGTSVFWLACFATRRERGIFGVPSLHHRGETVA